MLVPSQKIFCNHHQNQQVKEKSSKEAKDIKNKKDTLQTGLASSCYILVAFAGNEVLLERKICSMHALMLS